MMTHECFQFKSPHHDHLIILMMIIIMITITISIIAIAINDIIITIKIHKSSPFSLS